MPRTSLLRVFFLCVLALAISSTVPRAMSSDIVISQVYGGGGNSGATYKNDFVELYNRGSAAVSIDGWTIQYASSAGSSWQKTTLSGVIQPGRYYLVQEAAGSGGTTPLPEPDALGSIAMSATAGKVALVASATLLTGTCPAGPQIVDFVGYGGANCFEGAPTATLSNTTAALRKNAGATETDNNAADFAVGAPSPRSGTGFDLTGTAAAAPPAALPGEAVLLTVAVKPALFPPSTAIVVTADLSAIGGDSTQPLLDNGTDGDATPFDLTFSYRLVVPPAVTPGQFVLPATIADAQGRIASVSIRIAVVPPPVAIHAIQGAGSRSPLEGQPATTVGVVTAVKTNGFFIQTPDADADADPNTSEGIYVFTGSAPAVSRGDEVRVSGIVSEFSPSADPTAPPLTELSFSPVVAVLSSGRGIPSAAQLLPGFTTAAGGPEQLEPFEGMRVRGDLVVVAPTRSFGPSASQEASGSSGTSTGEFWTVINGTPRPLREPGVDPGESLPPGAPCCVPRFDGNPERLRVDSGYSASIPKLEVASGQVFSNFTGVLDYGFRSYTILPDAGNAVPSPAPPAAAVPAASEGEFTIGSLNMQRFFDTTNDPIDDSVMTAAGFERRLSKASLTVRNVLRMPDVLGLVEIENLGVLQAIADRVNADALLTDGVNPGYAAFLVEGNDVGGIDVGVLLKGSRIDLAHTVVTQVGKDATYPFDGADQLLNDRPPLVVETAVLSPTPLATPYAVTVIVNHLRSLNGIDDPVDGARVRAKRRAQAEFLAGYIQARQAANPRERIVSVGDYNAYQFNDGFVDVIGTILGRPADPTAVVLSSERLVDPLLTDLVDLAPASERYSFIFGGNPQAIDHVIVSDAMRKRFSRIAFGRGNADFPETYRAQADGPERLSDHDAPVGYFAFPSAPIIELNGDAVMTVEAYTTFTDPGATAHDEDGPLDVAVAGDTVDVGAAGRDFTIEYTATNGFLSTTVTRTVHVVDTTGPSIDAFSVTPDTLWAPNHKLVDVVVGYAATDRSGVSCSLDVVSNEPVDGTGDGNTAEDWIVIDEHHVQLRAERSGRGSGRAYTITATCTDPWRNTRTADAVVRVPADAR